MADGFAARVEFYARFKIPRHMMLLVRITWYTISYIPVQQCRGPLYIYKYIGRRHL